MRDHETVCPNCRHVFAPASFRVDDVVEQGAGDVTVIAVLRAGADDQGLVDTFRLPPADGEGKPIDWTPEAVEAEIRRRLEERLAYRERQPARVMPAAAGPYARLVGPSRPLW